MGRKFCISSGVKNSSSVPGYVYNSFDDNKVDDDTIVYVVLAFKYEISNFKNFISN